MDPSRPCCAALLLALLGGCAGVPALTDPQLLLADHLFAAPAEPVSSEAVFELTPSMRAYLDTRIAQQVRRLGPQRGLFETLRGDLMLEFDTGMTRTAAEAFEARSGNCLSLVILTAAFAKALSLPFVYQEVFGVDTWSHAAGLAILSGHVNLALAPRRFSPTVLPDLEASLTVDFLPPEARALRGTRVIDEARVLAMYHNNRAAESLADGDLHGAYWQARQALRVSPTFLASLNTLGVIYLRRGEPARAERALRTALAQEPDNTRVLANLARTLELVDRGDEARALRARLARLAAHPPFHFYALGVAALERGDYREALRQFERELARMPYDHEMHFLSAVAHLRLGDVRRARRHLAQALDNSTTRDTRALYAAKLQYVERTIH